MDAYCQFHPLVKSKWQCPKCGVSFCSRCVAHSEHAADQRFCSECSERLEELNNSAKLSPVRPWHQSFTLFFNSSLRLWPINLLVVTLVASFFLSEIFQTGLGAFLTLGGLSAAVLLISLGLCKSIALTDAELRSLPMFSGVFEHLGSKQVLALSSQLLAMTVLIMFAERLGFSFVSVSLACLTLGLAPIWVVRSILLSLVSKKSRRTSAQFERVRSMEVLSILKERYVELLLILYASGVSIALTNSLASAHLSESAAIAITMTVTALLSIMGALAIGLACRYVYMSKLQLKRKTVVSSELPKFDDTLNLSLKTGRYNVVLDQLEETVAQASSGYRLEQFYKLLLFTRNWNALERYSHRILEYLLVRTKVPECITLLHTLKNKKPNFRIWDANLCLRLAESFEKREAHSMLLWLSIDAHKRFPNEPKAVSDIYFMVAHVLEQQGQENEKVAAFRRFAFKLKNDADRMPPVLDSQLDAKTVTKPRLV